MAQQPQKNNMKGLVVITGASSGIGLACVTKFHEQGYPVLCLARRFDKMQKELSKLKEVICSKVDITNYEEMKAAIDKAEILYGPTNCLINNAGVMLLSTMDKQDPNEWDTMINVNIKGVLNGIRFVINDMKKRKQGIIINMSSIAGQKHFDNHTVYGATKFAVHEISEGLRQELSQHNVKVTLISPGAVSTELLSHTTHDDIKEGYQEWKKGMDQGVLESEDVANACFFAFNQPARCCIREISLAPINQKS